MDNYEDIIDLDYAAIKSTKYPRMPLEKRAAQFAPFSALKGLELEIEKITNEVEMELRDTKYSYEE